MQYISLSENLTEPVCMLLGATKLKRQEPACEKYIEINLMLL